MSAKGILRMLERWEREDVCMHGFEVRRRGQVIAEGYYAPFAKGQPHRMYSVSKTMVALAICLLLKEGKIALDDRIADFFPDKLPENPDPRILRLTLRDMLRMATCYTKSTYDKKGTEEWADSFFTTPATHEPGTLFHYDTSCTQVLGVLVERLSGMGLLAFVQKRIFDPIGAVDDKRWLTDPAGFPQGGTGLIMSLRDLGKVAQLMADGGRGIIDADLLRQATSCQIATPFQSHAEERFGYGWQLWMTRSGWAMYGLGGQLAIICPKEELILCTIADTRMDACGVQRIYDAMYDELIPLLDEPDTPQDVAALQAKLSSLKMAALPHSGHEMRFAPEYRLAGGGLKAVRVHEKAVSLEWEDGETTFHWDNWGECCQQLFPGSEEPCLVSAGMAGENTLRMRCHFIGDSPCGFEMLLSQCGKRVSVCLRCSAEPISERFSGLWTGEA